MRVVFSNRDRWDLVLIICFLFVTNSEYREVGFAKFVFGIHSGRTKDTSQPR